MLKARGALARKIPSMTKISVVLDASKFELALPALHETDVAAMSFLGRFGQKCEIRASDFAPGFDLRRQNGESSSGQGANGSDAMAVTQAHTAMASLTSGNSRIESGQDSASEAG